MKNLTVKWLKEKNACQEGINWFENQSIKNPIEIIEFFIKNKSHLNWGNWLIVRLMNKKQKVQYAVFSAEKVIHIYENKYPNDYRPRKAIEAVKKYLKKQSKINIAVAAYAAAVDAAYAAAAAAAYAAATAYATAAAAVVDAAYAYAAAAYAAYAAYDTAYAAAAAAHAVDAAYAAAAEKQKIQIKILEFGLKLLSCEILKN